MDGERVVVPFLFLGTIAGAHTVGWVAPCGLTLVRVDAVATTAAVGTFDLGTAADPDGIVDGGVPGASYAAGTFLPDDFNGVLCDQVAGYHVAKDTVLELTISNSSQIDMVISLTFVEG